jgi:thymidylate synthase (FAD)
VKVELIGWTEFRSPQSVPYYPIEGGGQGLVEFAGRACYQSWSRPNPKTATNAGYLEHILESGHFSVLEHGSVTFYFTGISRALSHELIRHRHFSYSQLSQRYVPSEDVGAVTPAAIAACPEALAEYERALPVAARAYRNIAHHLAEKFGKDSTAARKAARQAARYVLPNATETAIVVTGNYRAWRHFIALRATEHADVEIRELAVECLRQLQTELPNVFGDFVIKWDGFDDPIEVAWSPYAERS